MVLLLWSYHLPLHQQRCNVEPVMLAVTGYYFELRFSSALGISLAFLKLVHGTAGQGVDMLPLSTSKLLLESNL